VSSHSDNNAGDQTTTTSVGKIDELDTGNNSPCGNGKITTNSNFGHFVYMGIKLMF